MRSDSEWLSRFLKPGPPLDRVASRGFPLRDEAKASLTEAAIVGSYSWSSEPGGGEPLIPGRGPHLKWWSCGLGGPDLPVRLLAPGVGGLEREVCYVDENAHRSPNNSPLEPLVACLPGGAAGLDTVPDVVSDRNNLRKLLRFAMGARTAFRVDMHMDRHGTLFLCRRERYSGPGLASGFGKPFERFMTDDDDAAAGSHRHVITARLGDLSLLVRYEVDAIDDAGAPVELKCKREGLSLGASDLWAQMALSDTRLAVVGWHQGGVLSRVERLTLRDVAARARTADLTPLHGVLADLIKVAARHEGPLAAVCTGDGGPLEIRRCTVDPIPASWAGGTAAAGDAEEWDGVA